MNAKPQFLNSPALGAPLAEWRSWERFLLTQDQSNARARTQLQLARVTLMRLQCRRDAPRSVLRRAFGDWAAVGAMLGSSAPRTTPARP